MRKESSEVAYDYLRKHILSGEFPPGRSLLMEELAAQLGMSCTPIRDALRRLRTDGLVSIQPRLGASVKRMDATEYREFCGMRLALEGYAAGLAASFRTDADLEEMNLALEAMRQLTDRILAAENEGPMLAELIREDVRFHIAIMSAARNSLIKKEILRLHLIGRVVCTKGPGAASAAGSAKTSSDANRKAVLGAHQQIFAAIARSDAAGAKAEMERHIEDIIHKQIRATDAAETASDKRELTDEELAYAAGV